MRRREHYLISTAVALAMITAPFESAAQQGSALIRQGIAAYTDFDHRRALPLLRRGVDPNAGPRDSVWALGVQYLAQILYEQGNHTTARAWARWAVRLAPELPLDTLNLLSPVIAEFQSARAATRRSPEESRVAAEWVWPLADPGSGPGRIEVRQGGTPVPVVVTIMGRGTVGAGLSLPAGSYEIEARGPGAQPVRVTREVLPGITTVLAFAFEAAAPVAADVLRPDVRTRVAERIISLRATRFGVPEPECGAGALVGGDGLLLTTYGVIRGAERITRAGEAPTAEASPMVAAYDVARDLAVLTLPKERGDSLLASSELTEDQYAWAFPLVACRLTGESRVRVRWADRNRGTLRLTGALGGAAHGSSVITGDGKLLGVVRADTVAIAASAASDLLLRARTNAATGALRSVVEVARGEHHRYGSASITTPLGIAAVEIIPQEPWHWPELARSSTLPFTFVGPEGRYRLVVRVGDQVRYDSTYTVVAGTAGRLAIPAPQPVAAKKKRRWPWVVAALGGAGAAALLAGGGGDGGSQPTTGTITVRFPNPP